MRLNKIEIRHSETRMRQREEARLQASSTVV
jgi:hypothetical protein